MSLFVEIKLSFTF